MPRLTFIHASGALHVVQGQVGRSVMETAVENLVPSIHGECGGCASCATCHVVVEPAWESKLPPRSEIERELLEGAGLAGAGSRLSCQLPVTESLDGIVLRLVEPF